MPRRYRSVVAAHCACALVLGALHVQAEDGRYPVRPVRMIVPLAPGGGSDIVGRILAQQLTEHWGKPVVVDNRPGAGSTVGTAIVARAVPDGYTVLVTSSSIAISPALYSNLGFDVMRDLTGVTLIASQPSLLAVHPSVSVSSVPELVALARARSLAYGSAGVGSATHLGTALFLHVAQARMQHVPYKSAGQATGALLAGEVQVLLTNMASVLPHVEAGRLKAVGISSAKRSAAAPGLPTLQEAGLQGFEYATWYGMLVPARTDRAQLAILEGAAQRALAAPAVRARLAAGGLEAHGSSSAQFGAHLRSELARWAELIRTAEIRAD